MAKSLPNNSQGLMPTDYTEFLIDHILENFGNYTETVVETFKFRTEMIPELLHSYLIDGHIRKSDYNGIIPLMESPDYENWLIGLNLIKTIKKQRS